MVNYQEVRIKLRNTQLNKIKSAIILRIDKKIFKVKNCNMNYL